VINRLFQTLKVPFRLEGVTRVDDTPVHKAVREALVNCLVNADYYGRCGLVIKRNTAEITFENPGGFRVPIDLAISGGVSDPRNSVLMKMFNLLNIGERAGSGIPGIFHIWKNENLGVPQYEETMNCSRTKLTLPINYASDKLKTSDKRAIKDSDKQKTSDKQAIKHSDKSKTSDKIQPWLDSLEKGKTYRTSEIANVLDISQARARVYLKELVEGGKLKSAGVNKGKVYYLPE
jgi:predicted HTH transcriptional regulator